MEGKVDLLNFCNEKSIYKEFKQGCTTSSIKNTSS